jgi:hypothetical protein
VVRNRWFLQRGVVSTSPNPQAGGPQLVDCPWLLIQFIRSYIHVIYSWQRRAVSSSSISGGYVFSTG